MGPFKDGWTEADVEAVLARANPDELLYVPIIVSLTPPDADWSFTICKRLATHEDARVRANAMLAFGHLARMCARLDDSARALLAAALDDPDQNVRFNANDASHDINHFLGWGLRTLD